jgi:hypothetical protein
MAQINLAMLLSSQGATIVPPEFQMASESSNTPSSSTVTNPGTLGGAGPTTALGEAQQIMASLGSKKASSAWPMWKAPKTHAPPRRPGT